MVDLKGQYEKIKDEIDEAILNVVSSTAYINGPAVKQFQANLEKYLGVKHVIPVRKWNRRFAGRFDGAWLKIR